MIRFFYSYALWVFLFFLFSPAGTAQNYSCEIIRYEVTASFNESRGEYSAEASLWIRALADSLNSVTFIFPPNVDFSKAVDENNSKYSKKLLASFPGEKSNELIVELPNYFFRADSFFIRLEFDGEFEASAGTAQTITSQCILLRQRNISGWLPALFSNGSAVSTIASARLKLNFSSPKTLAHGSLRESLSDSAKMHFLFLSDTALSMENAFSFLGAEQLERRLTVSPDSSFSVSAYFINHSCNELFLDSLHHFLIDAEQYFSSLTGKKVFSLQYFLSPPPLRTDEDSCGALAVLSGSPAYSVFDSSAFQYSARNPWIVQLAEKFSLPSTDSLSWLKSAFAGFLATKYYQNIFFNSSDAQLHERRDVLSNILDFFPAPSLQQNTMHSAYERHQALFKGRYLFLMLEYVLGEKLMEDVITSLSSEKISSLTELQNICERRYGSSLSWFFQEWTAKTEIPEFVFSHETQRMPRGLYETKISVSQRGEIFSVPVTFFFSFGTRVQQKRIFLDRARQELSFVFPSPPTSLELDPQLKILRWLVDLRIQAHARTSVLYRMYRRNLEEAEREALLTLELDPNNGTGTNALALFSLGKISMLQRNTEKAQEYFFKAMQSKTSDAPQLYPLLSAVRYGNTLETVKKRSEAVALYQRALNEALRSPAVCAPVILLAEKYLNIEFVSTDEEWLGEY